MFLVCSNCCIESWRNKKGPAKASKIKPFINKYNWNGKVDPSKIDGS